MTQTFFQVTFSLLKVPKITLKTSALEKLFTVIKLLTPLIKPTSISTPRPIQHHSFHSIPFLLSFCSQQWETASLILCLHWAACANACGTNRGWQPFCFSVAHFYLIFTHKSSLFNTQIGMSTALFTYNL